MYEEYLNKTFNNWTIIQFSYKDKYNHPYFKCRCSCGVIKDVDLYSLIYNKSKSCGNCSNKKHFYKHNLSRTRLYNIYYGMKSRCLNPKDLQFKNYGARHISICKEWLSDFKNFYNWAIENGYSDNLTIDRIDVNGNYCPKNCRWTNMKIQANNKRNNHIIEYENIKYSAAQFCEKFGIKRQTLNQRIFRYGYNNPELLLKNNLKGIKNRKIYIEINGIKKSLVEWCDFLNVNYETIRNRIRRYGYSPQEALLIPLKNGKNNKLLSS